MKRQAGFTLIELLVVIVILGILSGLIIQQFGGVQDMAYDNTAIANQRMVQSSLVIYELLQGDMPDEDDADDLYAELQSKNLISEAPEYGGGWSATWDNTEKTYTVSQ